MLVFTLLITYTSSVAAAPGPQTDNAAIAEAEKKVGSKKDE